MVGELVALPEKERTDDAWQTAWVRVADQEWARGGEALRLGRHLTAASCLRRSAAYYQFGIAFAHPDDPSRAKYHRRSVEAFGMMARIAEPPIERVEIPYEGASFPAWFVPASIVRSDRPAVIYLPGWDSTKEQGVELALALAARGMSVLLCDGPGVGEAVAFRSMPNRYDYEVPGTAALEYLSKRIDVNEERIAVVGASVGGYRAARFAAFEHRLAAAVIWGAVWNFGAMWRRALASPGTTLPTRTAHALHVMGARDLDEVTRLTEQWDLTSAAARICSPLLILHGERDIQVPVEDAERLYRTASSEVKELKIFTEQEGGAAHCQNDNRLLAYEYIGDWLAHILDA